MDPVTAIGLIASIQTLLMTAYKLGQDTIHAKREIRALSIELSSLNATLEHIRHILDFAKLEDNDADSRNIFGNTIISTPEYKAMVKTTQEWLTELLDRLEEKSAGYARVWQRIGWHLAKSEVEGYIRRLERAKSWFTLAVTSDNIVLARESYRQILEVGRILQSQEETTKTKDQIQLEEETRNWLAPYNADILYRQALSVRQPGTGKWFLEGSPFQSWIQDNTKRGFWLRACPGFGKTVLMAGAIDHMKMLQDTSYSDITVAYWFCSFSEQPSQDLGNVLGGLIYQLCSSRPSLFTYVNNAYSFEKLQAEQSKKSQPDRLSLEALSQVLCQVIGDLGPLYLFIDAVNESKNLHLLVGTLNDILLKNKNAHIMISSPEAIGLVANSTQFAVVTVESSINTDDIELYINASFQDKAKLGRLPETMKDEIRSVLRVGAHGVFRWVQCQLQLLSLQRSIKDTRVALYRLPSTLEQTYQQALEQISPEDRRLANRMFLWLCSARRRMFLDEICEAVVLAEDEDFDSSMRLLYPEDILEICPSLISFNSSEGTLALAHSSVFKFLVDSRLDVPSIPEMYNADEAAINENVSSTADREIAKICLSYLMLPEFSSGWVDSDEQLTARLTAWPLLSYVADALWNHLYHVDIDGPISTLLSQLLLTRKLPRGGNFGAWLQANNLDLGPYKLEGTLLYWASRQGHLGIVRVILALEGTSSLEQPGGRRGSTPLHVASSFGHTRVVEELIRAGANAFEQNAEGEPGLFWAVLYHHHKIIALLINAGARLDREAPYMKWLPDIEELDPHLRKNIFKQDEM